MTDTENDFIQDQTATFDNIFAEDRPTAPDASTMVQGDRPASAVEKPAADPVEDRVRQVVDDRMARQEAERRARQLEDQIAAAARENVKGREAPDFFIDPQAFIRAQIEEQTRQVQERLRESQIFMARQVSDQVHTPEIVNTAIQAIIAADKSGQIDAREAQRISNSPNPFHEAVLWHKRTAALKEYGDDPGAYRKRLEEELLKDPQFQARVMAQAGGRPLSVVPASASSPAAQQRRPSMPQSLSGVGNAATTTAVTRDIDPDEAFASLVNG